MASIASSNIILTLPPSLPLCHLPSNPNLPSSILLSHAKRRRQPLSNRFSTSSSRHVTLAASSSLNSVPVTKNGGLYKVGDFMTKKPDLHVVKTTTPVDQALEALVETKVTGFPVIDDDWKLVGVVSDYDLLALDSISGGSQLNANFFPDVDSSWKAFNQIQKLLTKTHGKVVGDLMTPSPHVVRENTNLEDATRLLLETKYHRLPVVDSGGKLIGIITRGDLVRAALKIKRATQSSA